MDEQLRGVAADIDAALKRLKIRGEDLQELGVRLATLTLTVAQIRLFGEYPDVEESALEAIFYNITTAAEIEAATEIKNVIKSSIEGAFQAALKALSAL